jgi:predicted dehydrogenase
MPEQIDIGVIGAGSIFKHRHFPGLADIKGANVVAICNRSRESAREVADDCDLSVDVADDPEAVIGREDVDAIMIGTWPYKHCEYTLKALEAGKHTFVQARMAADLDEAKRMLFESRDTDLVTQICPSPFGLEADIHVRSLVDDGYLGEVYTVDVVSIRGRRSNPTDPLYWRHTEQYAGLNTLNVGTLLEVVHRWFGYAETVSANATTFIEERPLPDGDGTGRVERPDAVDVLCRMENGAQGNFQFSEVASTGGENHIAAYGSDGTLYYDLDTNTLLGGKAEDTELSKVEIPDEHQSEWTVERDFIDAIRNGGTPATTFYEGMKYMELTEAICRSVERGSEVRLPLVR